MTSLFVLKFFPLFLLPLFLLVVLLKKTKKKSEVVEVEVETSKLPPGPKKLPLLGNLHQLGNLPHRSLHQLSIEFGPIMFLQLGSIPTVVVSSADIAKEIFKNYDRVFSGRPILYVANKLSYDCCNVSFAPYGDYWRELRKIMVLELLSPKRIQSFEAIRKDEVNRMLDSIATNSSDSVNLSDLTLLLANNVTCRVAFGEKSKFHEILHETQDLLGGFSIADFFPWMVWLNKFNGLETRLEKNFRALDNFFDKVIKDHLDPKRSKSEDQEDVVDVLLRVQKDPSQAIHINSQHIKGVLTDIFIAGSDTSSATLEWTMAELIRHPSAMRKAQEEVREVVKGRTKVEETDLPELIYLKLVVKESLRLHPPAPLLLPRETLESCMIGRYKIPAKTRVLINATSIATDPKYWENPNEFQPERFLNSTIDFKGQDFEFLPFGAGRRCCPGINFSILLIEMALANLLHCFDWELPQGLRVEDMDMEEALGITMHKKTPLFLVAVPSNVYEGR